MRAKQRFNVAPFHLCDWGMCKDQFKNFAVLALHGRMAPNYGSAWGHQYIN
jgi:hypothetical protein